MIFTLFFAGASQVVMTELQVLGGYINLCVCRSSCYTWFSKWNTGSWIHWVFQFNFKLQVNIIDNLS